MLQNSIRIFLSIHASTGSRPNNAKAAEFEVFDGNLCNCFSASYFERSQAIEYLSS